MSTFSFFNVFVRLVGGISASCGEGWRRGRLALVFTTWLGSVEVELEPLWRRIPLNIARV
jgi:hypothetical protein